MEYRPSEIAAELQIHLDTVYRSLIPAGCPHRRDEKGHIWIVGTELTEWLSAHQRPRQRMAPGMAWCCKCHQVVPMQSPLKTTITNRNLELVSGTCPHCQCQVNRAQKRTTDKENHDVTSDPSHAA